MFDICLLNQCKHGLIKIGPHADREKCLAHWKGIAIFSAGEL